MYLDNATARKSRSGVTPCGSFLRLPVSAAANQPLNRTKVSGDWGPHRLSREEITAAFARGWRIDSLEPATIGVTTEPDGIRAWLAVLTRI